MNSYLPLILYIPILLFTLIVLRCRNRVAIHAPILYFLAYIFPFALRAAVVRPLSLTYSALQVLNDHEYLSTAFTFMTAVFFTVIVYMISFTFFRRKSVRDSANALEWIDFTDSWAGTIRNWAIVIATAFFIITLITIPRATDALVHTIELRTETRGWTFIPQLLSMGSFFIFLLFLECEGNTWRTWYLFFIQGIPALYSGSKGGAAMLLINTFVWLLMRRRIKFRFRYLVFLVLLVLPSIIVGSHFRATYEDRTMDSDAPAVNFSLNSAIGGILSRFNAMDVAQVFIARPDVYSEYTAQFWSYAITGMLPGALFPDKPLNPCLFIGPSVGYPPWAAAISESWLGGMMQLFGPIGLFLAPIVVGVTLSWFSKQFIGVDNRPSVKYPIVFSFGVLWLSIINEGSYYLSVLKFLPLFLIMLSVYIVAFVMNGRLGVPPGFRQRFRQRRNGTSPPATSKSGIPNAQPT